jgi:non-lysosomal glucosylceramidase
MQPWPILKSYSGRTRDRVAMPIGGIGTGTVSLCGFGAWRNWEVANRPAKGFTPVGQGNAGPFFALRAATTGRTPVTRLLEGPLPRDEWEGSEGASRPNAGLPRFRECTFHAAYPLAQLDLADPEVPLRVRVEAFNPLIPGDSERSGLPVVLVRVRLRNVSRVRSVEAAVAGVLPNFVGADGFALRRDDFRGNLQPIGARGGRNELVQARRLQGVRLVSDGVARGDSAWGSLAVATTATRGVTRRTAWAEHRWNGALLDFWDDFSADGSIEPRTASTDTPTASLAVTTRVPPGGERCIEFVLSWHFPNRRNWHKETSVVGNYYTTRFRDAWAAAIHAARNWTALERDTVAFVRSVVESDLPAEVREAALFNLSTLRSQTCFRTPDGRFFGWEGTFDQKGSCHGNCTHVWNYEHATAQLYPDLARSMREIEFSDYAMTANGRMSFRVALPLRPGTSDPYAAADGQMGCVVKLHREWRLSGDAAWLRRLWPHARKALEFAWLPGGWDADQDGVMEGCQHNTMDVEYYGPNPQMASWYLAALRAATEMARVVGDPAFAERCSRLYLSGRTWVEANLFNGEYYEQQVRPVKSWDDVLPGLVAGLGSTNVSNPDFQLGAGCLIDQLAGQVNAHFERFGHLLDPAQQRATLAAVLRHNRRRDFLGHFNHKRSYVLGAETGVLMATYPRGRRPARPFPYFTEVMTGFEYYLAIHLLQEGNRREALRVVRDVRRRYDGAKRSPFDEAECGHHYARALASWGLVLACTGFHYTAQDGTLAFATPMKKTRWPWAAAGAWGVVELIPGAEGTRVVLTVLHGRLTLRRLELAGTGELILPKARVLSAGHRKGVAAFHVRRRRRMSWPAVAGRESSTCVAS